MSLVIGHVTSYWSRDYFDRLLVVYKVTNRYKESHASLDKRKEKEAITNGTRLAHLQLNFFVSPFISM